MIGQATFRPKCFYHDPVFQDSKRVFQNVNYKTLFALFRVLFLGSLKGKFVEFRRNIISIYWNTRPHIQISCCQIFPWYYVNLFDSRRLCFQSVNALLTVDQLQWLGFVKPPLNIGERSSIYIKKKKKCL